MTEKNEKNLQRLFNQAVKEEAKSTEKLDDVDPFDEAVHEVCERLARGFEASRHKN